MHKAVSFSLYTGEAGIFESMASIPQCQVLFVGPIACTRHDILTAMIKVKNKMSHLCVSEGDIITGYYYKAIDNAVKELIDETGARAVVIITCCQNELIGTDYERICKSLRCKFGIAAESVQINRLNMYKAPKGSKLVSHCFEDVLCGLLKKDASRATKLDKAVNILGGIYPLSEQNELTESLVSAGYKIRHISSVSNYDDFLDMAHSALNIVADTDAISAAKDMERFFLIPWIDMSFTISLDELINKYQGLISVLGIKLDISTMVCRLRTKISNTCQLYRNIPILIDGRVIEYPYSVAKALFIYGFMIERIITTEFTAKEPEVKAWIDANTQNITVEFKALRQQSTTIKDHVFTQLKIQTPRPQYPIGFSYINQILDTLVIEYKKRRESHEQIVEDITTSLT